MKGWRSRGGWLLIPVVFSLIGVLGLLLILESETSAAPSFILPPRHEPLPSLQSSIGLQIDKVGPDKVTILDTITYTIRITNVSGQTLRNVVISDTYSSHIYPSGAPYVLAGYNGNYIAQGITVAWFTHTQRLDLKRGEIYWGLGDIPPGATGAIVLTMSVPYTLQPMYKSPGPEIGPSLLGNSLTATVPGFQSAYDYTAANIVGPVLKLEKLVQTETGIPNEERVGRLLTFTLRVENVSTTERDDSWPAKGLRVWDQLPDNLSLITATASVPGVSVLFTPTTRFITWTFPADFILNPGEVTFVTFTARITLTAPTDQASVRNPRDRCGAISSEMVKPVQCTSDVNVVVRTPQFKTAVTASPPTPIDRSYPNRPVTYTITIYNPLQELATGVVVTDMMPSTFSFVSMIHGPQPAAVLTNVVRWENLSLPPNGVISLTFLAWIGAQTPVGDGCGNRDYDNNVYVSAPAFPVVYMTRERGRVTVEPQIYIHKWVSPARQVPGSEVVYTITLRNSGNTTIGGIILTDSLPLHFRFNGMVSPPPPGTPQIRSDFPNVIWWEDVPSLAPGAIVTISFRALVEGISLQEYKNTVWGYSPDTSICTLTTAGVVVDPPVKYNKIATPTVVVQGETLEYACQFWNSSAVQDYTIDQFADTLPPGFQSRMGPTYSYDIQPPYTLLRNRQNDWTHIFTATVVGEGTGTSWCNDLGPTGRIFYQEKHKFGVRTTSSGWWVNAEPAAPVRVLPQVSLSAFAYPNPVGRLSPLTVTLILTNNLRGPLAAPVTLTAVYFDLPPGFITRTGTVASPPDECSSLSCVWRNVLLPASGTRTLNLLLRAPFTTGDYSRYTHATPENSSICVPRYSLGIRVENGVELRKTPYPRMVGPFGLVEYTIEAFNTTGGPVHNLRITDTLPEDFQYVSTTSGPQPISTSPLIWEISYLAPRGTSGDRLTIKFQARAGVRLGSWYNIVDGFTPSTYVTRTSNYMQDVELRVIPGVGLHKVVEPTQTITGQIVIYTITLYNASEAPIRNIRITDTLPAGFTYEGMVSGPPPAQTNPLVWQFTSQVGDGESVVLSFRARVGNHLPSGRYFNRVSGSAERATPPYGPVTIPDTGDTAPVDIRGIPTVERSKEVTPSVVRAGGEVTYTLLLRNDTPEAQTVRLTDTLPLSVTWAGMVEGPAPVMTSPTVVWDAISVGAGQTVTLRFRAAVDRLARSGTVHNRLEARVGNRVLPPLEAAPLTILEIPRVDAQVSIDDGRITASPGDTLNYTLLFTNASPITLTNVVLTATLEPVDHLSVSGAGWEEVGGGVYTYAVGSLAPGATGSTSLQAAISPDIPDSFWTMTATVQIGYGTAEEVIEENLQNNGSRDLDILRGPDLVVTSITWQPAQPVAGKPITFFVTVKNQGVSPATQRWDGSWDEHWLFVLELYARGPGLPATPPADVFDHIGGYCADVNCSIRRSDFLGWPSRLQAGEERVVPFVVNLPEGIYRLYAQADVTWPGSPPWGEPLGLIQEAVESNNIFTGGQIAVQKPTRYVYLPLILRNR